MAIPIATEGLEQQLKARGVRVERKEVDRIALRCVQCRTTWWVERRRLAPPDDTNRYWWCPNGCNREM